MYSEMCCVFNLNVIGKVYSSAESSTSIFQVQVIVLPIFNQCMASLLLTNEVSYTSHLGYILPNVFNGGFIGYLMVIFY